MQIYDTKCETKLRNLENSENSIQNDKFVNIYGVKEYSELYDPLDKETTVPFRLIEEDSNGEKSV